MRVSRVLTAANHRAAGAVRQLPRTPRQDTRGRGDAVNGSEAQLVNLSWAVVDGDITMPVEEGEWWGASLAILVAALHHPHLLGIQQPGTDPASVAKEVLGALDELRVAARSAEAASQHTERSGWERASIRRDGNCIVFSPGEELANFAWCLEVFAVAVLDRSSPEAAIARGATAYAASAWSRDIGKASGSLPEGRS